MLSTMFFETEIRDALRMNIGHEKLLELVSSRVGPREGYEVLERIWQEMGFDEKRESGPMQEDLEFVMEKLWYACPADLNSK